MSSYEREFRGQRPLEILSSLRRVESGRGSEFHINSLSNLRNYLDHPGTKLGYFSYDNNDNLMVQLLCKSVAINTAGRVDDLVFDKNAVLKLSAYCKKSLKSSDSVVLNKNDHGLEVMAPFGHVSIEAPDSLVCAIDLPFDLEARRDYYRNCSLDGGPVFGLLIMAYGGATEKEFHEVYDKKTYEGKVFVNRLYDKWGKFQKIPFVETGMGYWNKTDTSMVKQLLSVFRRNESTEHFVIYDLDIYQEVLNSLVSGGFCSSNILEEERFGVKSVWVRESPVILLCNYSENYVSTNVTDAYSKWTLAENAREMYGKKTLRVVRP